LITDLIEVVIESSAKLQSTKYYRMPTWYIPHGGGPCFFMEWNPPHAWDKMAFFLKGLSSTLPEKPKAIVMISAHWLEKTITVTGALNPDLIYDYYGFPEHTYELKYPAKGDPELAQKIVEVLEVANIPANIDSTRGFDHGMFIPMMLMFPNADIPTVQVSLNSNLDPQTQINLGQALEKLRDQGVLIIGSGMSFHNMRAYGNPEFRSISDEFDDWLTKTVESKPQERHQALIEWANAPSARLSHPPAQEEHLLPLMVVAGAASKELGRKVFSDRVLETTISAYVFG
jgi:aromatic ring-opening dioxygenase catalytic subunit (LigB family)